ncbi:MAG: insulinase family protein [Gemmatimonadaceae bacterium]|nr:insulinase family protein [Gemmatimonadaceae bacterium]
MSRRSVMRSATVAALGALAALSSARPLSAQTHAAGITADTSTSVFDVGGVHVILRRNTANDVVAANLYLLGGNQQSTPLTAGTEPFYLWVSERGTRHYTRAALTAKMAALGSAIVVEPRDDWTMFGFRGIRDTFDSTWAILTDRLMSATLAPADVEFIRAQVLAGVRQRNDSPDDLVQGLADSLLFAGQPYALAATGDERSLSSITAADLQNFRATQMVTSRMLLVVVGNIERARLEKLILPTLGTLPRGNYKWAPPPDPIVRPADALFVQRPLPTNYLLGYYAGPRSTSPDYQALRIATSVLSGRLFTEIRVRHNLTYDVSAPFIERAISSGGLYVTTVYPDSVLTLMRREIARMQNTLLDNENLNVIVQQFITEYFLNNETDAEQANQIARAELYGGDYRLAGPFVDQLRAVTPEQIRDASRKYMHGTRFAFVGDSMKVSRALLTSF